MKLTESQKAAVERNGNILVAAAAGSGKTAVLVERVIKKLCSKTEAVSADRLLIVTFTNAAAAEMRARIEKRLDEECRKNPDDMGLLLQKHLLSNAKICTIDSFCIDFVRENFDKAGVAPDFEISDYSALKSINEAVLSKIVRRYLTDKDPVFMELLDITGAEFDEKKFIEVALEIYDYSRQLPFPKKWFSNLPEFYSNGHFTKENIWFEKAFERAESIIKQMKCSIANAVDLLSADEKTANAWMDFFILAAEKVNELYDAAKIREWDILTLKVEEFLLPALPRAKASIPETKAAKSVYDYLRTKGTQTLSKLFYAKQDFIDSQFKKLYEPIKLLSEILVELDDEVFAEYCLQNTFTFHNIESLALNLLCAESDKGIVIKDSAKEFLSRFDEVCVDEYQDTNDLQNMLFYVLSDHEQKLFAVGDVKQSIYGFRGANPNYFIEKKNSRNSYTEVENGQPMKIVLGNNFRCKKEVCDFANYFFGLFMTKEIGLIDYSDGEELIPSAKFPDCEIPAVGIDIIDCKTDERGAKELEAAAIAEFIQKTMQAGNVIKVDDDTLRPAKYSDFTILLRSMKNNASVISAELIKRGIPVNYSAEGFLEFAEIADMLSLLKVIDNPRNDIALIGAMMSPIFGFTAEELALIRAKNKKESFYAALLLEKDENEKANSFLTELQRFRLYMATNTLPQLLEILLDETGLLNIVSAYPDGNRRKNNLRLLCNYAEKYSVGNRVSLSGFLSFIEKQSATGLKSAAADSGTDTVKIMSIHASKGLQFPVCIIAGTASAFNSSEVRQACVYSTEQGIAFKYFDEAEKQPFTTLGREVMLDSIKSERFNEELRLLYVAMTRTQDIMHFTAAVPNLEKKLEEICLRLMAANSEITPEILEKSHSYFEWLASAIMLHPNGTQLRDTGSALICKPTDSRVKVSVVDASTIPEVAVKAQSFDFGEYDRDLTEQVKNNINYIYPYEELLAVESKASVSALANKAESDKYAFSGLPSFMNDGGITPSERGTAMHKVMEFFDFSKWQDIETELERLREWQFLSEREADSINIEALKDFFASDVFSRILKSDTVKREMRFITELSARLAEPNLDDRFNKEEIVVQGAVDVCFVEDDGVVILDFKTDRVTSADALAEAYGEQLKIYSLACEKIFQKPVKERIIYSFALSKEIRL